MIAFMLALAASTAAPDTCSLGGTIKQGYASAESWYVNSAPIVIAKRKYVKYGLPRVLSPSDVRPYVNYKGAGVFIERGDKKRDVVYVLAGVTYPGEKVDGYGCEYQPYQRAK
jgi:hypothetical protein